MLVKLWRFKLPGIELAYCVEEDCVIISKYFPKDVNCVVEDLTHEILHKVLNKISLDVGSNEYLVQLLTKLSFM